MDDDGVYRKFKENMNAMLNPPADKLYLLKWKRGKEPKIYDINAGFVIRASSPAEARRIASGTVLGDERRIYHLPWMDPKLTSCTLIHAIGKAGIILTDYKEG